MTARVRVADVNAARRMEFADWWKGSFTSSGEDLTWKPVNSFGGRQERHNLLTFHERRKNESNSVNSSGDIGYRKK